MAVIRTMVVNINFDMQFEVYIGRGSVFGNKYRITATCTREQVVKKYEVWFYKRLRNPKFKRAVLKLQGKRLGCFCWPKLCHGSIIVEYLNLRRKAVA